MYNQRMQYVSTPVTNLVIASGPIEDRAVLHSFLYELERRHQVEYGHSGKRRVMRLVCLVKRQQLYKEALRRACDNELRKCRNGFRRSGPATQATYYDLVLKGLLQRLQAVNSALGPCIRLSRTPEIDVTWTQADEGFRAEIMLELLT